MEPNKQQTTIVVKSGKSMGLALVLTFFFGPLGMFYSTITGAIIMMILTPIVSLVSLGFGLPVMWIIQMIWAGVAANNSNNTNGTSVQVTNSSNAADQNLQATTPVQQISETPQATKYDFIHYEDANKLSKGQIEELLSKEAGELSEEFVKALKFVQNEREQMAKVKNERKNALSKAMDLNEEERKNRISSPSLYSANSIAALKYIQRCSECDIEPNTTGFLATFEDGYTPPETPTEREVREKQEEQERKHKKLKDKQEAERVAKQKKETYITFISVSIIVIGLLLYMFNNSIDNNLQETITTCTNKIYDKVNYSSLLSDEKKNVLAIRTNLVDTKLPLFGKSKKQAVVNEVIAKLDKLIEEIDAGIERQSKGEYNVGEVIKVDGEKKGVVIKVKGVSGTYISLYELKMNYNGTLGTSEKNGRLMTKTELKELSQNPAFDDINASVCNVFLRSSTIVKNGLHKNATYHYSEWDSSSRKYIRIRWAGSDRYNPSTGRTTGTVYPKDNTRAIWIKTYDFSKK